MSLFNIILDFFYPPKCLVCDAPGKHPLCNDCLAQLEPRPSTFSLSMFNVLTILPYENAVRDLIHIGKFGGHEELWNLLAEVTAPYLQGLDKRVLIPVPIHPLRIRERGYNQSALIAKRLSRILGWEYCGRLIRRKRNSLPQFQLNYEDRAENVKHAFAPYPFANVDPKRHYMLVDDVITTSSTLQSCASVLYSMGATLVDALAVARAGDRTSIILDSEFFM